MYKKPPDLKTPIIKKKNQKKIGKINIQKTTEWKKNIKKLKIAKHKKKWTKIKKAARIKNANI